ncbi:antizyme inhibitor 1b-like [Scleropages formosus]|uniref:Antizyme inhibitor 1b-like n=1 Tax=Scleropages formosus TaxID=113540 RepID=A0A0P7Z7V1_SCLFO|nr:antizyme inhibitor 1b-like [Scleropages formosus]
MKGLLDEQNITVELLEGGTTLGDVIDKHIYEQVLAEKSAFLVANLGVLMQQHVVWQSYMAPMRPFYPVKCNSDPAVIGVLAALGTGFICTSKTELTLVLGFGIAPGDIIFAGGCKQLSHIKYAAKSGVKLFVCDNEVELCKIARCHPGARLLLEVATASEDQETSMAPGCSLKACRHLLECAKELDMQVVGIRFQVPSSCRDFQAYSHAVADAQSVFDMGVEFGFNMRILDIGSGFSGSESHLKQVQSVLGPLLKASFPDLPGVDVIAEPGSFYVSSAFTLVVNIVAKKATIRDGCDHLQDVLSLDNEPEFLYYMNDGVYGSFANRLLDRTIPAPSVHKKVLTVEEPVFASSLWGTTSDELEQVVERCLLPELSVGDWLVFSNMGVHDLGGLQQPPVHYISFADQWSKVQEAGISCNCSLKNCLMIPRCS